MSSFFKPFFKTGCLGLAALLFCGEAWALSLSALYQGACRRSVGVILEVGEKDLTLLNLSGDFEQIDRFDVIYLAHYSLGQLPLREADAPAAQPLEVTTEHFGEMKPLVRGWPIDFAEEEISFLNLQGQETVVRREAIWDLEPIKTDQPLNFPQGTGRQLNFVHPYPFAHCPAQAGEQAVYPQQLLGDPLLIRREFDRLEGAYKQVADYRRDKIFYAVPQVYRNYNSLGLWLVSGSRYGSSMARVNSFIPSFVSELSEGPFGFQRILVTGTHPMPYGLHEEPQSQFYYSLKADYVHFSIMYDFDRLLLGEEKYKWKPEEMETVDFRLNDLHHIMGGFDYGSWAIEYMWLPTQYALNVNESFFRNRVDLNKTALTYRNRHLKADLHIGWAVDGKVTDQFTVNENDTPEEQALKERLKAELEAAPNYLARIRHYRLNLDLSPSWSLEPRLSLIRRTVFFRREAAPELDERAMRYLGASNTLAFWLRWGLPLDLSLEGFAALEQRAYSWGHSEEETTDSNTALYPKAGVKVDLTF